MRSDVDPLSLTPEDRFREVAALLAASLLRLHARPAGANPQKSSNSSPNCLEFSGEAVLSGHTG